METIIERNDMISRNIFGKFSLYVGDLDPSVEDGDLYKKFSEIGEVSSVKICRDCINGSSLGYAYVNFNHGSDADKAMKELNFKEVKGKQMRIMFSKRDPSIRNSGKGNMFVKNLDKSFDNKQLHHLFSSFGLILSCKVACDASAVSMGYGFVQYYSETSVLAAKIALDGAFVRNQYLKVCPFVSRRQWDESPVFTKVYVKNLVETTTDDDLKRIFKVFGEITSAVVMKDGKGKSRKFGFVNFEKAEAAAIAVEKMNGMVVEEKELYVGRAQKKKNRIEELRNQIKQEKKKEDVKNLNLYVKNLDNSVNEEKLREVFSECGTITSCKVMVHSNGLSKGVGFVAFSTSEEASKAMIEINGKTVGKKPIYVSLAQRKEEREVVSSARKPSLQQRPIFGQANGPTMMLPPHLPFRGYNIEPPQPQFMFGARTPNGCPPMLVHNFMMPFPFQRPALYPPSPISLHHGLQPMTSMPLP